MAGLGSGPLGPPQIRPGCLDMMRRRIFTILINSDAKLRWSSKIQCAFITAEILQQFHRHSLLQTLVLLSRGKRHKPEEDAAADVWEMRLLMRNLPHQFCAISAKRASKIIQLLLLVLASTRNCSTDFIKFLGRL